MIELRSVPDPMSISGGVKEALWCRKGDGGKEIRESRMDSKAERDGAGISKI